MGENDSRQRPPKVVLHHDHKDSEGLTYKVRGELKRGPQGDDVPSIVGVNDVGDYFGRKVLLSQERVQPE